MSVPSTVRVKISSEAVESISLTPVVVQEMKLEELISAIVSATGKDEPRIHEILHRGTQVISGSRFRWDRLDLPGSEITRLLAAFPDPEPQRPFDPARCNLFDIKASGTHITIEADHARQRRLFRTRSFWDEISALTGDLTYVDYSYKQCADVYRLALDAPKQQIVRDAARLLPFSTLVRQIETGALDSIDFFVKR